MMYTWSETNFAPYAITYAVSFIALFIGSITDLKTREVPDWLNYGLIISGVGLNLLFSTIYSTPHLIINSLIGLIIFFGIAYIMFYAGQWGGGDSKILMGLGAMIGLDVSFKTPQFLFWFFINALFVGAMYGLLWSSFLIFKNKKKFLREWNNISGEYKILTAKWLLFTAIILFLAILFAVKFLNLSIGYLQPSFLIFLLLSLLLVILITFYLWIFVKAIEKSSMYKLVEPSKLTEGDWIVKDIFVNKQYICGPKDLGIDKKQIKKLIEFYNKGKVKKVLIKEGIPFVPNFLIAFIVTLIFGNPLVWLV